MSNVSRISEFLSAVAGRGRAILGMRNFEVDARSPMSIVSLCSQLLSAKGNASGLALSQEILRAYLCLNRQEKLEFFHALNERFALNKESVKSFAANFIETRNDDDLARLAYSLKSDQSKLISRLNQAPNATLSLIQMRADLLQFMRHAPDLRSIDADFVALFESWFNGGFLELQRLNWSSPADLLENIMQYEAVHGMSGWGELRMRIAPEDRLVYGFFHPRLGNEPLIFIEVALMDTTPSNIATILEADHVLQVAESRTAVFYSISNCQVGLRGIPLGSFLIKQVVEDLKANYPQLREYVTLSPVPGFSKWLASKRAEFDHLISPELDSFLSTATENDCENVQESAASTELLKALAAHYITSQKDKKGRPLNSVAKFHLGNGASLGRINWPGDLSENGIASSHGVMVNYHYDLDKIEQNHEEFVQSGQIQVSTGVSKLEKVLEKYMRQQTG